MAPKMSPAPAPSVAHVQQAAQEDALSPLLREIIEKATPQAYDAGRFAPRTADELWQLAETWYWSELLPEAYYPSKKEYGYEARFKDTWARRGINRAYIVMRHGASLGVLPEPSIKGIYIVEGTPCPSASLMLAMAIAKGLLKREDWRVVEAGPKRVAVELFGTSRKAPERVEAKLEDYKHLQDKNTWRQYPEDMLMARAISRAMRRYFADAFAGVYAAEERADFRLDRAAGRIEDPVERVLAMVDQPEDPAPVQQHASDVPAGPAVERDASVDVAALGEGLRQRIESLGAGDVDRAKAIGDELRAMPDSAERRALVRALQAKGPVVRGEVQAEQPQAQSGEGGGA